MSEILIEEYLVESKKEEGKFYLEGVVAMSETKNQNGRIYPKKVLNGEMNKYIVEHLEKNNAYGQGGHPDHLRIDLDDISHRFVSLKEDGCYWNGKAVVSDTPKGRIIKALMEDGGSIGMSSRAAGTVKMSREGIKIVQEDFKLKAFDAVISPSCAEAIMTHIYEHKEVFYCENEQCYMLVEDIRENLTNASQKDIEKVMLESFDRYVKQLNF